MSVSPVYGRPPSSKPDFKAAQIGIYPAEQPKGKVSAGKSFDIKNRQPAVPTRVKDPIPRPSTALSKTQIQSSFNSNSRSATKIKNEVLAMRREATQAPEIIGSKARTAHRPATEIGVRPGMVSYTSHHTAKHTELTSDSTAVYSFSSCQDFEAREKERQRLAYQFGLGHLSNSDADLQIEQFLSKSLYRATFEKLLILEFKVNEFVPFYVCNPNILNKNLPLGVIQFEGVMGCSHSNIIAGAELVLTKKYTCADYSQRKGCFVDQDFLGFLHRASEFVNSIIIFQKWNSKTKDLASYLKDHCSDTVKGIFFKKINNKSSKFISYNKITSSYQDLTRKDIFVLSPLRADIQYWQSIRKIERKERVLATRAVEINDINDFDVILPLASTSMNAVRFDFQLGFIEEYQLREADSVKTGPLRTEEAVGGFSILPSTKVWTEKALAFLKGERPASALYLVPYDYASYSEFHEGVTFRNYLKHIRKKEDESRGLNDPPPPVDFPHRNVGTLFTANAALLQTLPVLNSPPIYALASFLAQLKDYTKLVNKKNAELYSIVRLSKCMQLL